VPGVDGLHGLVVEVWEEIGEGDLDVFASLEEVVWDRFPPGVGEPDDEPLGFFAGVPLFPVLGFVGVPEGDGVGVGEEVDLAFLEVLEDPFFEEEVVGVKRHDEGVVCAEKPVEDLGPPVSHGRPPL